MQHPLKARRTRAGGTRYALAFVMMVAAACLARSAWAIGNAPSLEIPIPTIRLSPTSTNGQNGPNQVAVITWISDYIGGVYLYASLVATVLAAVMLIIAGFQYVNAGGDAGKVGAAKERIKDALVGLVLVIGAFTLLQVTNPALVQPKGVNVQLVKRDLFVAMNAGDSSTTTNNVVTTVPPPPGSPPGTKPTVVATSEVDGAAPPAQGCFRKTFGATDAEVGSKITKVTWLGKTLNVHQLSAADWQAAFKELEDAPADSPVGKWMTEIRAMPWYSPTCKGNSQTGGSYVARIKAHDAKVEELKKTNADLQAQGKPLVYVPGDSSDLHMFGLAIDIDPCRNPWVHKSKLITSMPNELAALMASHKLYWGGLGWKSGTNKLGSMWPNDPNFVGDHDAMHFEWHGACW